jgi:hypothetical protein
MIYLTIINTLPVKKKMKNAFYENHIFTRFNLTISKTIDRFEKVEKAEDEELVLGVTADVHGDAVTGTSTESSRWSDWIPVFIFRYQTSRRQPRQIF